MISKSLGLKMINVNILIWLLILPILAIGQDFVKLDTLQEAPIELQKLINNEEIIAVLSIDITGDSKSDYIVTSRIVENEYKFFEYWVSADFNILRRMEVFGDGIQIRKFINIDLDPELELINAIGFEDGIDYTIQDFNVITGELKTILYFNPIIETELKDYWGYPWDWTKLKINQNNKIKASLNHNIERDGNITIPKNQKIMPAIYFEGNPTQEITVEKIQETNWLIINEIVEKSR